MCGIWFYYGKCQISPKAALKALRARGPEASASLTIPGVGMKAFTRLAINGLNEAGMQPMSSGSLHWMCNGEIYNWKELAQTYGIKTTSGSDCEIIGPLYKIFKEQGIPLKEFFRAFDGVFSCVIVDDDTVIVARDPYGVRPLYVGTSDEGLFFASEMKAIIPYDCPIFRAFPPGSYEVYKSGSLTISAEYHTIPFLKSPDPYREGHCLAVQNALVKAVQKRMLSDRPVAALVSGGVDSSLVAAIVAAELRRVGAPPLNTFSIGFEGSSDLECARKVASWIGSIHHEIVVTPEEFFAAIPTVIQAIESFDTTTVRASVGNYLVAKAIKDRTDCKVVFNGDGSDEVWGSYLYFYNAPSDAAFEAECDRLLTEIQHFDVLRSDRCISSHGLEPRTPFLDKEFVAVARGVPTAWRRPGPSQCEKSLLRDAFRDTRLLPDEILYRRKEAFSDGVSGKEKSWYEIAQEMASLVVPIEWEQDAKLFSSPYPTTAEQFYYRSLYKAMFPYGTLRVTVPHFWLPKWSGDAKDPSARSLSFYSAQLTTP